MRIFEDIIDNIESRSVSDNTSVSKDFVESDLENVDEDSLNDYKFGIQFSFNKLPMKLREEDKFFPLLRQIREFIISCIQQLSIIEDTEKQGRFMLMNRDWNNDWNRRKEEYVKEFEYEGIKFYNEPGSEKRLHQVSNFDFCVNVNFTGDVRHRQCAPFAVSMYKIGMAVQKKFLGDKKNFSDLTIFNYELGRKQGGFCGVTREMLDGIMCRNSYSPMINALQRLEQCLVGSYDTNQIKEYFSKCEFNLNLMQICRKICVQPTELFASETDKCMFLTIPKDMTVLLKESQIDYILNQKDHSGKHLLITVEGTLRLETFAFGSPDWKYRSKERIFERFMSECVAKTINTLIIDANYLYDDYVYDLSSFFINTLKVNVSGRSWDPRSGRSITSLNEPKFKFMQKPKKFKIVDRRK